MGATIFTRSIPITSDQLAKFIAAYAADKKAADIVILDMRQLASFTDFFVICSGNSEPHLKAIAGAIEEGLRKDHHLKPRRMEGYPMSQWVIADYIDVVVHIFHEDKRAYYSLEDLWSDAPRLALDGTAA